MQSINPLNPWLYRRLCEEFGQVVITSQGQAAIIAHAGSGPRDRTQLHTNGEQYSVRCPSCADPGTSLSMSYLWGRGHDVTPNDDFGWAARCHHANCLCRPGKFAELLQRVYRGARRDVRRRTRLAPGRIEAPHVGPVQMPGGCTYVDELPGDHVAARYLTDRGFDPDVLARHHEVCYCERVSSEYHLAQGRIIVPVYMRGERFSWQARHIGEADWQAVRKYHNCPGPRISHSLYGYDEAKSLPFAIVVGSVTDVWAIGCGAVAVMGKSISPQQSEMLRLGWKALIVLFDREARERSANVIRHLQQRLPVAMADMPPGDDPASLCLANPDWIWDRIEMAATALGVDLLTLSRN